VPPTGTCGAPSEPSLGVATVREQSLPEWQAPPGWPSPPEGWSPPPGWVPDPSWPPAPPNWQWWKKPPWSTKRRVITGFGIAVATLVVVSVIGFMVFIEATDSAAGCGSVDPTDPANYSTVTIVNDTSSPVVLSDCPGTYCHPDLLPANLDPGKSFSDDAACGSTGADMTSWRVSTPTGRPLGYIAVDSPKSRNGLVFDVSRASPNRTTPTPTG
jgi:hypothetical protein